MLRRISCSVFLLCLLSTLSCHAASAVKLPDPTTDAPLNKSQGAQTVVLAGGCFWGIQAVFEHVKGVSNVTTGYSGGSAQTAQYETVSTGATGHAESVRIVYDPGQISFGQLLKVFFLRRARSY